VLVSCGRPARELSLCDRTSIPIEPQPLIFGHGPDVRRNIGCMAGHASAGWPSEHGFCMVLCALFDGIRSPTIHFRKVEPS
jgi:hypothetical protein